MWLMADWIMPFQGESDGQHGRRAKCRVSIYEHGEPQENPGAERSAQGPPQRRPLVVLGELADNEGESVSSAAEVLVETLLTVLGDLVGREASGQPGEEGNQPVAGAYSAASASRNLARGATFIIHYPPQTTAAAKEAYELIRFDEPRPVEVEFESGAFAGEPPSALGETPCSGDRAEPSKRTLWCVDGVQLVPLEAEMVRELLGEAPEGGPPEGGSAEGGPAEGPENQ